MSVYRAAITIDGVSFGVVMGEIVTENVGEARK